MFLKMKINENTIYIFLLGILAGIICMRCVNHFRESPKEEYIDNNAKIIYELSPNDNEIFSDSSIVVLGNVPEEYTIRSLGNIIVTVKVG